MCGFMFPVRIYLLYSDLSIVFAQVVAIGVEVYIESLKIQRTKQLRHASLTLCIITS
jgi:hypothetical protein